MDSHLPACWQPWRLIPSTLLNGIEKLIGSFQWVKIWSMKQLVQFSVLQMNGEKCPTIFVFEAFFLDLPRLELGGSFLPDLSCSIIPDKHSSRLFLKSFLRWDLCSISRQHISMLHCPHRWGSVDAVLGCYFLPYSLRIWRTDSAFCASGNSLSLFLPLTNHPQWCDSGYTPGFCFPSSH